MIENKKEVLSLLNFLERIKWGKVLLTLVPTLIVSILFLMLTSTSALFVKSEKPAEPRSNASMVLYTSENCNCEDFVTDWNSFKEANSNTGVTFKHISYSDFKYDDFFKIHGANGTQQVVLFNNKGEVVGATTQKLSLVGLNNLLVDGLNYKEPQTLDTTVEEGQTEEPTVE